jgi:hypothetical protein
MGCPEGGLGIVVLSFAQQDHANDLRSKLPPGPNQSGFGRQRVHQPELTVALGSGHYPMQASGFLPRLENQGRRALGQMGLEPVRRLPSPPKRGPALILSTKRAHGKSHGLKGLFALAIPTFVWRLPYLEGTSKSPKAYWSPPR